jgi:hypothetical protein
MTTQNANKEEEERPERQAMAQLQSITEMIEALEEAQNHDDEDAIEKARTRIEEDPLSVEIRSEWHTPGSMTPGGQYKILLCWGGPACQIVGELNEYNEPESAKIEYQDWGIPWTDYPLDSEQEKIVLTYARVFYYGE